MPKLNAIPAALVAASAAFAFGGSAAADDPSFRYCEAGYVNQDVGLSGESSTANFTAALSSDAGSGFRGACTLALLGGLFVHGEYSQAEFDVDAALSGNIQGALEGGVDTSALRIGGGLAVDIPFLALGGYGQVSYTHVEYDGDLTEVVTAAQAAAATAVIDTDDSGFDLEVGARGLVFENLDLGGFIRYTSVGALKVPANFAEVENDDDILVGAQAALRVLGPVWVTGRYELGETDSLFVGVRAAF